MIDLLELETLMDAARRRVLLANLVVVGTLIAISSQIPNVRPWSPVALVNTIVWGLGCCAVVTAGVVWYRIRSASTRRLALAVRDGHGLIVKLERYNFSFHLLPLGVEIYIEFATGEHFAVGYWTNRTADRLVHVLAPLLSSELSNTAASGAL